MRTIITDTFSLMVVVCSLTTFVACQPLDQQLNEQHEGLFEPVSGCTSDQIQLALNSINSCENTTSDITATLKCISATITKNNTETWNIFLKNTPQNADALMYWTFDNCSINLPSYGKLNRNYVLWPAESYLGTELGKKVQTSTKTNSAIYHSQQKRQNHIQKDSPQSLVQQYHGPNFICPEWKKTEVNNILTACDISGNNRAAQCIQGRIRDQMAQNWNVHVATTVQSDTNYYFFNGCSIQVNFGTYARRIYIWKATE